MRYFHCLAIVATLLIGTTPQVFAHAFPKTSEPAVGATVSPAPGAVKIWFTQKIEPAFSKVEVDDAAGKPVDQDDAQVDAKDQTLLHVSLKALPPGTYKVVWHVVSVDTHATNGDFTFTVK
jgi:methionine-rich copper-binding protein CopC